MPDTLTNADIAELTDWRHALHRAPELSGEESRTAQAVTEAIAVTGPDRLLTGLGGHGVAAVYLGASPGPTLMLRAELDGLPITELTDIAYRSASPGKGHLCGHDGHMAILAGVARTLARKRPACGRVVLLFQPAEEDGSGAAKVLDDPRYGEIAPDWAFALHNMPGVAQGHALLAAGPVNCASRGLCITLAGRTAHAAQPEAGLSPAMALSRLIPALSMLGQGGALSPDYRLVTITHARLGAPAFGVAPGHAEIWATLRSLTDAGMASLLAAAETLAEAEALASGLSLTLSHHDIFRGCTNHPQATDHLAAALDATGIRHDAQDLPMRASEDFGRFGAGAKAAMVFLGAGTSQPALHNPDYDFPDALIVPGTAIFRRLIDTLLSA
ncbi:MAG: amidohydrolase [Pseudorhodobacter sp.]|nr:amidohydrolase [Pseudorhodobacter sp.]